MGTPNTIQGLPTVCSNDKVIAQMAIDYFLERGIGRFARFGMFGYQSDRLSLFSKQLTERGMSCLPWHAKDWEDLPSCISEVKRELKRDSGPIGVLAGDDEVAATFIDACCDEDIAIPEQLAVLGIHNDKIRNELSAVSISSIEDGMNELGYQAASLLDRILDGNCSIPDVTLVNPLGVVSRKSTDITVESEPRIRRAIDYMKRHLSDSLCNAEIAKAAGVSRRNLFELFNKRLGRSPGKALERIRVEHAKAILRDTDEKLYTVAAESGLSSANNLQKVFKRVVGVTPGEYRKAHAHRDNPPTEEWVYGPF